MMRLAEIQQKITSAMVLIGAPLAAVFLAKLGDSPELVVADRCNVVRSFQLAARAKLCQLQTNNLVSTQ
jgi:hypothetical protein